MKCKECNIEKVREIVCTYKDGKNKFADENGKRWNGKTCPECTRLKRLKGKNLNHPTAIKGEWGEIVAENHFKKLGYITKRGDGKGVDLILNGLISVEVKTVTYDSRWRGYYHTSPIKPTRKNDDLLCIVFDEDKIILKNMRDIKTKTVDVTKEVRSKGWV